METENFFTQYTAAYDKIMSHLTFYRGLIQLHREALQGRKKILESGCGPGALALKLLEDGAEVHALDQNSAALGLLRVRAASLNSKLTTYCRDAQDLSIFPDEHFDGVSSMLVLMFMPDPMKYLKEHVRVLGKGGVLVVSGADPRARDDVTTIVSAWKNDHERQGLLEDLRGDWELFERYTRQNAAENVKRWFTLDELAEILERQVGLRVVSKSSNPIYLGRGYVIIARKD